jgi:hypothetical protein
MKWTSTNTLALESSILGTGEGCRGLKRDSTFIRSCSRYLLHCRRRRCRAVLLPRCCGRHLLPHPHDEGLPLSCRIWLQQISCRVGKIGDLWGNMWEKIWRGRNDLRLIFLRSWAKSSPAHGIDERRGVAVQRCWAGRFGVGARARVVYSRDDGATVCCRRRGCICKRSGTQTGKRRPL